MSPEVAAAALRGVFGEGLDVRQHLEQAGDEEEGGHAHGALSTFAAPEQQLLGDERLQWARMERLEEEARRRRIVAWLQVRRGVIGSADGAPACSWWRSPDSVPTGRGNLQLTAALVPAAQRRGHRWEDIRGLLHQLEKEDAQRALDGEEE